MSFSLQPQFLAVDLEGRHQAVRGQELQRQEWAFGKEARLAPDGSPICTSLSVLATVRDKHGKIVADLAKDDFVLDEDGRPQIINYFAREKDLPLRLGLLVDTSLSQRSVLDQERSASYAFLGNLLRADKDVAAVINFDRDVTLLQDFTSSRPKLQAALQQLETPRMDTQGGRETHQRGGGGGSGGGGRSGGGTLLYDAVYLASDKLMSEQQGRKALIILSDGVDHGSKETLAGAIETAQRADTLCIPSCFPMTRPTAISVPTEWAPMADTAADIHRRNAPTERKFSNRSQSRRATGFSRCPRKSRLRKFTPISKKNCATSTASGTRRRRTRPRVTIRFISPRTTKT